MFSGPLPPPQMLADYDKILPSGADRIMKMAETQGEHRRKMEDKALSGDFRNSTRGSWFGFILGMSAIIFGFILLLVGKNIEGYVTLFGGLAPLVGAFLYGSYKRRKERIQKYGKNVK
jgi:uncharacterized membrane protein